MVRKAVVMAGGRGTRLRPVTETVPKPFVRIAGRPCIEYVLDSLKGAGVTDVVLTTFYKPTQLVDHLGGGSRQGVRLFYSLEDAALGTAGGVRRAAALLDETFIVASGDVLADVDLAALVKLHQARGAAATMALTEVPWDEVSEFGIVATDDEGRVERFQEKPDPDEAWSNEINTGIYVLEPEALERVPEGEKFDFSRDLFPLLLDEGVPLYAHPLEGLWMDVGRPADLIQASILMAERHHGGAFRRDATVHGEAQVRGSSLYPGVTVDDGAVVEESVLYDRARVGRDAVVRGSILCEDAVVEEGAVVEDAVLGEGARVAASGKLVGEALQPGETRA